MARKKEIIELGIDVKIDSPDLSQVTKRINEIKNQVNNAVSSLGKIAGKGQILNIQNFNAQLDRLSTKISNIKSNSEKFVDFNEAQRQIKQLIQAYDRLSERQKMRAKGFSIAHDIEALQQATTIALSKGWKTIKLPKLESIKPSDFKSLKEIGFSKEILKDFERADQLIKEIKSDVKNIDSKQLKSLAKEFTNLNKLTDIKTFKKFQKLLPLDKVNELNSLLKGFEILAPKEIIPKASFVSYLKGGKATLDILKQIINYEKEANNIASKTISNALEKATSTKELRGTVVKEPNTSKIVDATTKYKQVVEELRNIFKQGLSERTSIVSTNFAPLIGKLQQADEYIKKLKNDIKNGKAELTFKTKNYSKFYSDLINFQKGIEILRNKLLQLNGYDFFKGFRTDLQTLLSSTASSETKLKALERILDRYKAYKDLQLKLGITGVNSIKANLKRLNIEYKSLQRRASGIHMGGFGSMFKEAPNFAKGIEAMFGLLKKTSSSLGEVGSKYLELEKRVSKPLTFPAPRMQKAPIEVSLDSVIKHVKDVGLGLVNKVKEKVPLTISKIKRLSRQWKVEIPFGIYFNVDEALKKASPELARVMEQINKETKLYKEGKIETRIPFNAKFDIKYQGRGWFASKVKEVANKIVPKQLEPRKALLPIQFIFDSLKEKENLRTKMSELEQKYFSKTSSQFIRLPLRFQFYPKFNASYIGKDWIASAVKDISQKYSFSRNNLGSITLPLPIKTIPEFDTKYMGNGWFATQDYSKLKSVIKLDVSKKIKKTQAIPIPTELSIVPYIANRAIGNKILNTIESDKNLMLKGIKPIFNIDIPLLTKIKIPKKKPTSKIVKKIASQLKISDHLKLKYPVDLSIVLKSISDSNAKQLIQNYTKGWMNAFSNTSLALPSGLSSKLETTQTSFINKFKNRIKEAFSLKRTSKQEAESINELANAFGEASGAINKNTNDKEKNTQATKENEKANKELSKSFKGLQMAASAFAVTLLTGLVSAIRQSIQETKDLAIASTTLHNRFGEMNASYFRELQQIQYISGETMPALVKQFQHATQYFDDSNDALVGLYYSSLAAATGLGDIYAILRNLGAAQRGQLSPILAKFFGRTLGINLTDINNKTITYGQLLQQLQIKLGDLKDTLMNTPWWAFNQGVNQSRQILRRLVEGPLQEVASGLKPIIEDMYKLNKILALVSPQSSVFDKLAIATDTFVNSTQKIGHLNLTQKLGDVFNKLFKEESIANAQQAPMSMRQQAMKQAVELRQQIADAIEKSPGWAELAKELKLSTKLSEESASHLKTLVNAIDAAGDSGIYLADKFHKAQQSAKYFSSGFKAALISTIPLMLKFGARALYMIPGLQKVGIIGDLAKTSLAKLGVVTAIVVGAIEAIIHNVGGAGNAFQGFVSTIGNFLGVIGVMIESFKKANSSTISFMSTLKTIFSNTFNFFGTLVGVVFRTLQGIVDIFDGFILILSGKSKAGFKLIGTGIRMVLIQIPKILILLLANILGIFTNTIYEFEGLLRKGFSIVGGFISSIFSWLIAEAKNFGTKLMITILEPIHNTLKKISNIEIFGKHPFAILGKAGDNLDTFINKLRNVKEASISFKKEFDTNYHKIYDYLKPHQSLVKMDESYWKKILGYNRIISTEKNLVQEQNNILGQFFSPMKGLNFKKFWDRIWQSIKNGTGRLDAKEAIKEAQQLLQLYAKFADEFAKATMNSQDYNIYKVGEQLAEYSKLIEHNVITPTQLAILYMKQLQQQSQQSLHAMIYGLKENPLVKELKHINAEAFNKKVDVKHTIDIILKASAMAEATTKLTPEEYQILAQQLVPALIAALQGKGYSKKELVLKTKGVQESLMNNLGIGTATNALGGG